MKKKLSLIIPANSDDFYIEDILINILLWSLPPSEIIIVVTANNKIKIDKYIKPFCDSFDLQSFNYISQII